MFRFLKRDVWRKPYQPRIEHYNLNPIDVLVQGFFENGTILDMTCYRIVQVIKDLSFLPELVVTKLAVRKIMKSNLTEKEKKNKLIAMLINFKIRERIK